ncbi:hypothetical protein GRI44_12020 [Altererythrobacter confluentis]|uniref:Uncharacterized protein n=1 Tax=Allopontixanthobacter confluentis TaxID=1849021 RepID=A0A6L7GKS4_9SPHN|nr:hypothetical protein [Allopontixanthobacter confluentis]MXP15478.1 hypothetical protein [Allopontixanthobacter confluentis]
MMRRISYLAAGLAALLMAVPAAASSQDANHAAGHATGHAADHAGHEDAPHDRGQAELAKLLEGRVAGEPVRCIGTSQRQNMQIIDRTAMVFGSGRTIYVNAPDGVQFLDRFDVPIFRIFGSQLCRMDRVELRDRAAGISGPQLLMSDFIPYTLAPDTLAPDRAD